MLQRRLYLQGLCALGALEPVHARSAPPVVRMGYFDRYPPFSEKDASGKMHGLLIDSTALVGELAGLTLTHQGFPWARTQRMVEQGELDGFCTFASTERAGYALFCPTPLLSLRYGIYHRRDDDRIADIRSVADLRALRQGSYLGGGYVKEHLEADRMSMESDPDALLRRLLNGSLDVFPESEMIVASRVKALGLTDRIQFTPLGFLPVTTYCWGMRRSYPNVATVLTRVETAIQTAHRKKALQDLLTQYL